MKHLELKNPIYKQLLKEQTAWLETLGYAAQTVYNEPIYLTEFLHFLEGHNVAEVTAITQTHVTAFFDHLQKRPNYRRGGGLSLASMNKYSNTLTRFMKYLQAAHEVTLPVKPPVFEKQHTRKTVLTQKQVKRLFEACEDELTGKRDKAMLTLFYGCGLRKSEAVQLDTTDVQLEHRRLWIRKAKNRHERYVPLSKASVTYLENYLYGTRELMLAPGSSESALMISTQGKRMSGETMVYRLNRLGEKTGLDVNLHLLRHSIATHLLQGGMDLEDIALFLGHRCLDSTQIYTHLLAEIAH